MTPRPVAAVTALLIVAMTVCGARSMPTRGDSAGVTRALDRYVTLVEAMASDSIAAMFTPDGELLAPGRAPVIGPKAIAGFLHTFDAYHVLAETMTSDRLRLRGDTALQGGRYRQRVRLPTGDTVVASGRYEITWVRVRGGAWRIRRMGTLPPAKPTPAR